MTAADWKHKLTPTTAEIDAARARSPGEGLALAMMRTAMAALYTLAEEAVVVDARGSGMTDREYLFHASRWAGVATDGEPPLSRARLAARLLGWVVSFFEHIEAEVEPDHVRHYEIMLAVGYHAGMLSLDEVGLFDIAAKAEAAKAGRGRAVRKRNLEKTAWHEPALALARRHRETFPHRATAQIASVIDNDRTINSPSPVQVLDTLREWEKAGKLAKRKPAGK